MISNVIESLLSGDDVFKRKRVEYLEKIVFNRGSVGKVGIDILKEILNERLKKGMG